MPSFESTQFGRLDYPEEAVIEFPLGLPAFEDQTRFLPIEDPATAPLVFLQSLLRPELAFITVPLLLISPGYQLEVPPEDLEVLELPADRQPAPGGDVLCLAIVTVGPARPPTANLLAPIVVNVARRRAVQVIQTSFPHSLEHPLFVTSGETPCS